MSPPPITTPAPVSDRAFLLDTRVDLYGLHHVLEARFGPRREAAWLWSLQRDPTGDVCIVRLPCGFVAPALAAGEHWLFRLHARVGQKDRVTGRRGAYRRNDADRRRQWLERRGGEHGFAVVLATVRVVREPVRKPGARFWLDRSEFSGVVEIVDPDKVAAAMTAGIGGGRAWGLGMLRLLGKTGESGHGRS